VHAHARTRECAHRQAATHAGCLQNTQTQTQRHTHPNSLSLHDFLPPLIPLSLPPSLCLSPSLPPSHSLTHSLSLTHTHTHSLSLFHSLSFSLSLTNTLSLCLSPSLSHAPAHPRSPAFHCCRHVTAVLCVRVLCEQTKKKNFKGQRCTSLNPNTNKQSCSMFIFGNQAHRPSVWMLRGGESK
jgi:hypothetical protein